VTKEALSVSIRLSVSTYGGMRYFKICTLQFSFYSGAKRLSLFTYSFLFIIYLNEKTHERRPSEKVYTSYDSGDTDCVYIY
jgi:hypothetical protein